MSKLIKYFLSSTAIGAAAEIKYLHRSKPIADLIRPYINHLKNL